MDRIALDERTIADLFKSVGYATGMVGKWHNGAIDFRYHPCARGFDEFVGFRAGLMDYWDWVLDYKGTFRRSNGRYLTDVFSDEAVHFIDRHHKEPFLLYVAYNAPHWPFEAPEEDIARNSHIANEKRRVYAGMITALDDAVGGLVSRLKEYRIEENTMIFFISDNGAPHYPEYTTGNNLPLRGKKGDLFEGGIRIPYIVQWKDGGLPAGTFYNRSVSSLDVLPTALAAAGKEIPASLTGANILPFLQGYEEGKDPTGVLYWRWMGQRAVRKGDWKWISHPRHEVLGLYDLSADPGENINLIESQPDVAAEMEGLWNQWNRENITPLWRTPAQMEMMNEQYEGQGM